MQDERGINFYYRVRYIASAGLRGKLRFILCWGSSQRNVTKCPRVNFHVGLDLAYIYVLLLESCPQRVNLMTIYVYVLCISPSGSITEG